jgi:hypothetical protein
MADAQDETPLEKAEEAVRHEVDEVEVATLLTVDEIKDTVHDAVEKVKGLGHHHHEPTD